MTTADAAETAERVDTHDASGEEPSLWRNRDFRRFLAGQFVTNAGDSL